MSVKLFIEALVKFVFGIIIVGLLVFLPAGTLYFMNGWLFMALLFIPIFIVGIIMMIKNPDLLKSRLDVKEKESEQKSVVVISGLMFLIGFVIAGLNYRFNWLFFPDYIVVFGSILFILSYLMYVEVLRENSFLSRTIKVNKKQRVVDTGLYSIVRHPMYLITIFLFLSMPLILNSLISFLIFLVYPFIIIKRINNEEKILEKELYGYKEYKKKVRYKLIPFIW